MTRLFVALSLALSVAQSAAAGAPSCESTFGQQLSLPSKVIAKVTQPVRDNEKVQRVSRAATYLIDRLKTPLFNFDKYERTYKQYEAEGLSQPKSREARLAYFRYVTNKYGKNQYDIGTWTSAASYKELRRLSRAIGRINPEKGLTPGKIEAIYEQLTEYSANTPYATLALAKAGINVRNAADKQITEALRQESTKQLASRQAVEAFAELGLIRDPKFLERIADQMRRYQVTKAIFTGAQMIFERMIVGSPVSFPSYSHLSTIKIDPAILDVVEREGFDAAYPLLKAKYGHLARFDQSYYVARSAFTTALLGYMLIHLVPTYAEVLDLPPNLINSEMNAVQITERVVGYYAELTVSVAKNMISATPDESARAARIAELPNAKPHVALPKAAETPVAHAREVRTDIISPNRVTVTFDQQLAKERQKPTKVKPPPTSNMGSDTETDKALSDNLDYLNSLDYSAPTNR